LQVVVGVELGLGVFLGLLHFLLPGPALLAERREGVALLALLALIPSFVYFELGIGEVGHKSFGVLEGVGTLEGHVRVEVPRQRLLLLLLHQRLQIAHFCLLFALFGLGTDLGGLVGKVFVPERVFAGGGGEKELLLALAEVGLLPFLACLLNRLLFLPLRLTAQIDL